MQVRYSVARCCCASSGKGGNVYSYTTGTGTIDPVRDPLQFGSAGTLGVSSFVHFTNVSIANGATITTAYAQWIMGSANPTVNNADKTPWNTNAGTSGNYCVCDLAFEDVDNATRHTSYGNARTAALTTNKTNYSIEYHEHTRPKTIQTPDIASSLQELVNRPGWSSGNKMNLHFREDGTSDTDYSMIADSLVVLFWT